MININTNTTIYRPINQVFDFVSTPENDFQWQFGTLASSRLSREVGVIGSFFRSIGHLMGRRNLSTFELTEYEPGKKYGFKSLSGPLNSHISYTFEMSNGGTKVNISTQVKAVDLSQFNENILEKMIRKQLRENLALLKKVLEARQISLS
ncbi:MAG TPA: SRPBCC family protein [Anaerolineales bacterium]|nr:SRPBCC family protein [Anaerolineales bacterium]